MGNIIKWKVPVDSHMTMRRFKKAISAGEFTEAMIVAMDKDGDFVAYSTKMSRKDALWLIEMAKLHIIEK